jgi:hypothetical protein
MQILGYNKPFFAFGQSHLNRRNNNCYYYSNGNHMMIKDTLVMALNNNTIKSVYNFKTDSTLDNPLLHKHPEMEEKMLSEFKAFLQTHNSAVMQNNMHIK